MPLYAASGGYPSTALDWQPTQTTSSFWQPTQTWSTGGTYNAHVWQAWVTNPATVTAATINVEWKPQVRPEPTARELLITENRRRSRRLRRAVAERRAEALLREHLSPEQRDELDRLERFHVIADDQVYRIRRGWAGNVELIRDGRPVERWCVHPNVTVPTPDNMLAQKLMLDSGQAAELRRIANITRVA